jgi:ADP-ribosylglycohydrolase
VIVNAFIAAAIKSPQEQKATHDELFKQVEADLSIAAAQLGRDHPDIVIATSDAAEWLREDITLARDSDPMLYGPDLHLWNQEKYVRTALRLALWEIFHAPDFEQALIDVVNRGGDSDTNAAITGALWGAWVGVDAIPVHWRNTVLEALLDAPGPLAQTYHPNNLMLLAGAPVDVSAEAAKPEAAPLMGIIRG